MQENKTARRVCTEGHRIGIVKEGTKGINDGRVQQGRSLQKIFLGSRAVAKGKRISIVSCSHEATLAPTV
jgi:hypothetical protein